MVQIEINHSPINYCSRVRALRPSVEFDFLPKPASPRLSIPVVTSACVWHLYLVYDALEHDLTAFETVKTPCIQSIPKEQKL